MRRAGDNSSPAVLAPAGLPWWRDEDRYIATIVEKRPRKRHGPASNFVGCRYSEWTTAPLRHLAAARLENFTL
jgi:hypothetical protein